MGDVSDLLAGLRLGGPEELPEERLPPAAQVATPAPSGRSGQHKPERQPGLVIGDQHFADTNRAWQHIDAVKQRLLGRYIGPSHSDFRFLQGLLARHTKGPAKVSHPPVRQFTACSNVRGRGVEFHFVDSAGEEHDFSAKKCMDRRDEPLGSKLRRAMELAVGGQAEEFKRSAASKCALCSAAGPRLQVDRHNPPLLQMCSAFLAEHHGRPPVAFAKAPSGGAQFRPEDAAFGAAWQEYHRAHAQMRLLCEACEAKENARRGVKDKGAVVGSEFYPGSSGGRGRARGRGRGGGRGRGRG
ncbi:hypothetical protein ABPG77_002687 [Micractinium sp. CCAP 211/92]